jgi:hypothetical protein
VPDAKEYISETVLADVSSAYGRPAQAKAIFCRFTLASLTFRC